MSECERCEGTGFADDPTACGDEEHCSPYMCCPDCNPGCEDL